MPEGDVTDRQKADRGEEQVEAQVLDKCIDFVEDRLSRDFAERARAEIDRLREIEDTARRLRQPEPAHEGGRERAGQDLVSVARAVLRRLLAVGTDVSSDDVWRRHQLWEVTQKLADALPHPPTAPLPDIATAQHEGGSEDGERA